MCIVTSNKALYEIIIKDNAYNEICSINFASISLVCRFLEDVNFDYCNIELYRKGSVEKLDVNRIMDCWINYFMDESEDN